MIFFTDLLFLIFLFNPTSGVFTCRERLLKDRKLKLDEGSNYMQPMAIMHCRVEARQKCQVGPGRGYGARKADRAEIKR